MFKRLFVFLAALGSAGAAIGFVKVRAQFRTWGIDPAEGSKPLPGDDLVPNAEAVDTRGIDIAASPKDVWPWLVQMGYGRAGWYSYDELDMDRESADRIVPELQKLEVGDLLPTHPGGGFVVRVLEPKKALVVYADRALVEDQAAAAKAAGESLETASTNVRATGIYLDKSMPGDFQASWAFVLEPRPEGGARLLERFRGHMELAAAPTTPPFGPAFAGKALLFGLFVMVRRQMLGIRDRAEGRPISHSPWRRLRLDIAAKANEARAKATQAGSQAIPVTPTTAVPTSA